VTARLRWSVCVGGYPNGWDSPMFSTDDPEDAISIYEKVRDGLRARHARWTTVAIFDDNGEGEPLQPERMRERMREQLWDHGWHRAAQDAPDAEVVGLWKQIP
jgi:hypothetical protein